MPFAARGCTTRHFGLRVGEGYFSGGFARCLNAQMRALALLFCLQSIDGLLIPLRTPPIHAWQPTLHVLPRAAPAVQPRASVVTALGNNEWQRNRRAASADTLAIVLLSVVLISSPMAAWARTASTFFSRMVSLALVLRVGKARQLRGLYLPNKRGVGWAENMEYKYH